MSTLSVHQTLIHAPHRPASVGHDRVGEHEDGTDVVGEGAVLRAEDAE